MKLLAVLLLVVSAAFAQQLPAAPSTSKQPDYSQEAYVVESQRTVYRFENDGTGRKEVTARIRVQTEAGVEAFGQLIFGYSSANESVQIPYVRVLKSGGVVVTAPASAIQAMTSCSPFVTLFDKASACFRCAACTAGSRETKAIKPCARAKPGSFLAACSQTCTTVSMRRSL